MYISGASFAETNFIVYISGVSFAETNFIVYISDASFAENFYGLKRVPSIAPSQGTPGLLPKHLRWKSLIFLVRILLSHLGNDTGVRYDTIELFLVPKLLSKVS